MFSVIENSLNSDAVNLDALYLVKLIFGKYFLLFRLKSHHCLMQLQLYLDANCVLVRGSVNRSCIYLEKYLKRENNSVFLFALESQEFFTLFVFQCQANFLQEKKKKKKKVGTFSENAGW